MQDLEPAIPPHLRELRTCPVSTPPNYSPPFPAYTSRFSPATTTIVVAIFGTQAKKLSSTALDPILKLLKPTAPSAPKFHDTAACTDALSYAVNTVIAYWDSRSTYDAWRKQSGFEKWWASLNPAISDATSSNGSASDDTEQGWFLEIFSPPAARFETVFSDDVEKEGCSHMRTGVSGAIAEHVYWGSARDRLPVAQEDAVPGSGWRGKVISRDSADETRTKRIRVRGQQNLCVIRSGQDWSATRPEERKLYLESMHPVLEKGMYFLRDEGATVGCYDCRMMSVQASTKDVSMTTDKTFGLAYFESLESLEKWSKEHKTHLDIFGGFLKYANDLNSDISLRLYHEVLVLTPEQQEFEYVGCHARTGMLAAGEEAWVLDN